MQGKYDRYVSLGQDCEVSFQHRRILGTDSSGFFSWNVTTFAALESLLTNNFSGILQEDNLEIHGDGSMLRDTSHDFLLHSPFVWHNFREDPSYTAKLSNLRQKFSYFVEKFYFQARSRENVAYFYKVAPNTSSADVRSAANRLHALLRNLHDNHRFSLIILQTRENEEPHWPDPGIFNRYLRRFAPWDDAADGHVSSWDKVFTEFPHANGLHLSGY